MDGAPVQIWVNNTGGPPGGRLHEADPEALESAFARHLLASDHSSLVLPGMWKRLRTHRERAVHVGP